MKNSFPPLVAALICAVPQLASAIPVNATFSGTVSGSGAFTNVLSDFPVDTVASFNVTFDDAGLVDDAAQVTDYDVAPVSGWLRLGSLEWLFDAGRINAFSYTSGPGNPVISYGLQAHVRCSRAQSFSRVGGSDCAQGVAHIVTTKATHFGLDLGPLLSQL